MVWTGERGERYISGDGVDALVVEFRGGELFTGKGGEEGTCSGIGVAALESLGVSFSSFFLGFDLR